MSDYDALLKSISAMAEDIQALHVVAVNQCAPEVNAILATSSRDAGRIEQTLDLVLDHAGHPEGLELFKTLCRYYYAIDPATTAGYVHAWRALWDADEMEDSHD
jgi:alkylhydroperoxidase family enzyme